MTSKITCQKLRQCTQEIDLVIRRKQHRHPEERRKMSEAEVHRIAGEIALKSPQPDATKAETFFKRALAVARQQQAKSWELRAAMSLARLWRDQARCAKRVNCSLRSRLVHRGVRHARFEGCEGVAGGVGHVGIAARFFVFEEQKRRACRAQLPLRGLHGTSEKGDARRLCSPAPSVSPWPAATNVAVHRYCLPPSSLCRKPPEAQRKKVSLFKGRLFQSKPCDKHLFPA